MTWTAATYLVYLLVTVVMLVLGVLHVSNVLVPSSIRCRGRAEALRMPPLPPQGWTQAPYPAPHPGR